MIVSLCFFEHQVNVLEVEVLLWLSEICFSSNFEV